MCYEPSYYHLSRAEQAEERERIHAHHTELRANLDAGLPGAKDAYDAHIEEHRRKGTGYLARYGDDRARSILGQRKAEARVAARKAERREALAVNAERREASRLARIERRAVRREAAAAVACAERILNREGVLVP